MLARVQLFRPFARTADREKAQRAGGESLLALVGHYQLLGRQLGDAIIGCGLRSSLFGVGGVLAVNGRSRGVDEAAGGFSHATPGTVSSEQFTADCLLFTFQTGLDKSLYV